MTELLSSFPASYNASDDGVKYVITEGQLCLIWIKNCRKTTTEIAGKAISVQGLASAKLAFSAEHSRGLGDANRQDVATGTAEYTAHSGSQEHQADAIASMGPNHNCPCIEFLR